MGGANEEQLGRTWWAKVAWSRRIERNRFSPDNSLHIDQKGRGGEGRRSEILVVWGSMEAMDHSEHSPMALPIYRDGMFGPLAYLVTWVRALWLFLVGPISPALDNSHLLGLIEGPVQGISLVLGEGVSFSFHLLPLLGQFKFRRGRGGGGPRAEKRRRKGKL